MPFTSECPSRNEIVCARSKKIRILTTQYDLPDLRGRQEYIEVFRGLKSESDPEGICFAFHRAGAEIAENSHFRMGTSLAVADYIYAGNRMGNA